MKELLDLCDRLEALAKEATPGEWIVSKRGLSVQIPDQRRQLVIRDSTGKRTDRTVDEKFKAIQADLRYVAALDPATVSTLTAAIRRLIGERDAAWKENDALRFAYANSSASCFYCQLPASRMSECERLPRPIEQSDDHNIIVARELLRLAGKGTPCE